MNDWLDWRRGAGAGGREECEVITEQHIRKYMRASQMSEEDFFFFFWERENEREHRVRAGFGNELRVCKAVASRSSAALILS